MSDLMTRVAAAALEDPSLRALVMPSIRLAMEHPSPEARGQYLKDHPNADPKNHTLKGDPKPKGGPKDDAPAKGKGEKKDEAPEGKGKKDKGDKGKVPQSAEEFKKAISKYNDDHVEKAFLVDYNPEQKKRLYALGMENTKLSQAVSDGKMSPQEGWAKVKPIHDEVDGIVADAKASGKTKRDKADKDKADAAKAKKKQDDSRAESDKKYDAIPKNENRDSAADTAMLRGPFDAIKVPGMAALIDKLPTKFLSKEKGYDHPAVKRMQKAIYNSMSPKEIEGLELAVERANHNMLEAISGTGLLSNNLHPDAQKVHAQLLSTWRALRSLDPSKGKGGGPAKGKAPAADKDKPDPAKAKETARSMRHTVLSDVLKAEGVHITKLEDTDKLLSAVEAEVVKALEKGEQPDIAAVTKAVKKHIKTKGKAPAADKDKPDAKPKSTGTKAKQTPALKKLLAQHSLESSDADALLKWKKAKPAGVKITDAERLRRFLAHAKPETRERMKGMSPADFMKIYNALMDEEEGGEGGKAASLIQRTAAAAMTDPSLRDLLMPLLRG